MARRHHRSSPEPPTRAGARPAAPPVGPVPVDSGTAELRHEQDRSITLMVNGVPSSHLDPLDPTRLDFEYMQQLAAVLDRLPGPLRVLHLGAGGCTMARYVAATHPGSRQLAVEHDAALIALVRAQLPLPRSPELRIRHGEARAVLSALPEASYDVVIRDVFLHDTTPPHLRTAQFAELVRRVLRPGGAYLANCADRPPLAMARSEVATVRSVFDSVAVIAEPGQLRGRRYGNLVLLAGAAGVVDDALARALRSLPAPARLLDGAELDAFAGSTAPLLDPAPSDVASPGKD